MKQETYKFDTAGFIYPYSKTKRWNFVYRVTFTLKDKVQPQVLSQAVRELKDRFPTFYVKMVSGFFGYKLAKAEDLNIVEKDRAGVCTPVELKNTDKPLFKILYTDYTICGDFFHGIADGYGSTVFMKTLVAQYYRILGVEIPSENGVLDATEKPSNEELDDAYLKLYEAGDKTTQSRFEKRAYQHEMGKADAERLSFIKGKADVASLKAYTKKRGITVNQLLVAVYIYSFYKNMKSDNKKPIKVSVPINLRGLFPSKCLRNFSLYANVGITPGEKDYTLDDVIDTILPQLEDGLSPETLKKVAAKNVKEGTMPLIKVVPNFILKPILKNSYYAFGMNFYTSPLTNIGVIKLPQELEAHVTDVHYLLGSCLRGMNNIYCAVCAYGDDINIVFSYLGDDTAVQTTFFDCLSSLGVTVGVAERHVG